jgi:hypothetical protein
MNDIEVENVIKNIENIIINNTKNDNIVWNIENNLNYFCYDKNGKYKLIIGKISNNKYSLKMENIKTGITELYLNSSENSILLLLFEAIIEQRKKIINNIFELFI